MALHQGREPGKGGQSGKAILEGSVGTVEEVEVEGMLGRGYLGGPGPVREPGRRGDQSRGIFREVVVKLILSVES